MKHTKQASDHLKNAAKRFVDKERAAARLLRWRPMSEFPKENNYRSFLIRSKDGTVHVAQFDGCADFILGAFPLRFEDQTYWMEVPPFP